LILSKM